MLGAVLGGAGGWGRGWGPRDPLAVSIRSRPWQPIHFLPVLCRLSIITPSLSPTAEMSHVPPSGQTGVWVAALRQRRCPQGRRGSSVQLGWDAASEAPASRLAGEQTALRGQVTGGLSIK